MTMSSALDLRVNNYANLFCPKELLQDASTARNTNIDKFKASKEHDL